MCKIMLQARDNEGRANAYFPLDPVGVYPDTYDPALNAKMGLPRFYWLNLVGVPEEIVEPYLNIAYVLGDANNGVAHKRAYGFVRGDFPAAIIEELETTGSFTITGAALKQQVAKYLKHKDTGEEANFG